MKLFASVIALGFVAKATAQDCGFCVDGITADDPNAALQFAPNGESCSDLEAAAPTADDVTCVQMKAAEVFCCPPTTDLPAGAAGAGDILGGLAGGAGINLFGDGDGGEEETEGGDPGGFLGGPAEDPCMVCPSGNVEQAIIPSDGEDEGEALGCEEAVEAAMILDASSEFCPIQKAVAVICCPGDFVGAENPCIVCPDGPSVAPDTAITEMDGTTCEDATQLAKIFDADAEECTAAKAAGFFCCPEQVEGVANPCPVCPGGVTAAPDTPVPVADGATCENVVMGAQLIDADSEDCQDVQGIRAFCCPDQMEVAPDPCDACPDGMTVAPDTIVPDVGVTCEVGLKYAKSIPADSEECPEVKATGAAACCPKQEGDGSDEAAGKDVADPVTADETPSEAGDKKPAPVPSPGDNEDLSDPTSSSAYLALHLGGGTVSLISIVAYLL